VEQIYFMVVTCFDVCIVCFIFLWLYNGFFIILYNILNIAELDCCQIIILSICVPSLSNCCSYLDGIWTHAIAVLQHHSLSFMSSALDHSTTSAPQKWSFNSRSVTLSYINGVRSNPIEGKTKKLTAQKYISSTV
jgi:hypothetical protein